MKASRVASGMPRFYQASAGLKAWTTLILAVSIPVAVRAQVDVKTVPLVGNAFTLDDLRDLPVGNNPLTAMETITLETIADRFTAGGLNAATPPRAGGLLNSWTQTTYRVGDVSITDPRTGGLPMLTPTLSFWQRTTVATGGMMPDESAPAVSMTLEPRRPGTTWTREVEGTFSAPPLVAAVSGPVPVVDRVRNWTDGEVLVSGPLSDRAGIVAAGSFQSLSHVEAPISTATTDNVATGMAHFVFTTAPGDELRVLGWGQHISTDAFSDSAVHVQSTWERRDANHLSWRIFGGFTSRDRTTATVSPLIVDDLTSDPVTDLFDNGAGTDRRWTIGARIAPPRSRWLPNAGVDVEGARMTTTATQQKIDETVDGTPARLWTVRSPGGADSRHMTTIAVFANEHIVSHHVTVDAGVRLEHITAAADAASTSIDWTTALPRASVRWDMTERMGLSASASYRRSAYQLPLNVLAIGDPAAPFADVAAWNGGLTPGALIARVGPGTGGDSSLTQIDPQLQRPTTDELVLAFRSRPAKGWEIEIARITKREQPLLTVVDTGVPASSYSTLQVPDPSFIPTSPVGAPAVTVFNRPAGAYGSDRYLLTNQTGDPAKSWALELNVRASTEKALVVFGIGLTEATAPAAAVGYLPTENDQDVIGNLFVDPNSATYARGQLFQDRSHVAKGAFVYRFPHRIHVGAIMRYQDGQPFARLVIAPSLTQGATAVRAYANGGSAFTYIGTLDLRAQKTFTIGGVDLAAIVDIYNLPNLANEVSEYVVSGPLFRTPTALQPPRTVLIGARVIF